VKKEERGAATAKGSNLLKLATVDDVERAAQGLLALAKAAPWVRSLRANAAQMTTAS